MTRVDFYVLPQADIKSRELYACRLTEKAVRHGHSVYLHTDSHDEADRLDAMLWSFRADSFLPHCRLEQLDVLALPVVPPVPAVVIGCSVDPGPFHDVLINLSAAVPVFFGRFARVSEVVVQTPAILEATRNSFKFYKDRGFPLHTHRVDEHARSS